MGQTWSLSVQGLILYFQEREVKDMPDDEIVLDSDATSTTATSISQLSVHISGKRETTQINSQLQPIA
jgi:hypothetical protein